jgi:putative ABC transport system permease protein
MDKLLQDLRYGFRGLIKSPAFTAIAVIAIALGVGATTSIFSVVNAVLFRSLPYHDPERLVVVWEKNIARDRRDNVVSPANYLEWVEQNQSFEQMAAVYPESRTSLTGAGEPEEFPAHIITASFFPVLGVQPALGRNFTEVEDSAAGDNVAIISYGLWQRRFGGDASIFDKPVTLDGRATTIVGVMPADFDFFNKKADVWLPLRLDRSRNYRETSGRFLSSVARLKEGVSVASAQADMETLAKRFEEQYPAFNKGWGANVVPIHEQVVGGVKTLLIVLFAAVCFVLLIACANVANLLLARAAGRQREFALRVALGAGRGRIIRQLLTESLLLAGVGGIAGLFLAYWGVELLVSFAPQNIPRLNEIGVDKQVLAFTLGVSLLTGIIFGLLPAFQASNPDLNESLKEGSRSSTGGIKTRRVRSTFVVAEVALALVLLVGAGLLIRSFMHLQRVDTGFNAENVLTMRVMIPVSKYREGQQRVSFYKQAEERIASLPGVTSVGAINWLPLGGQRSATSFSFEDRPSTAQAGEKPVTDVRVITPSYFQAMGIPLIKGRLFDEQDVAAGRKVMVISDHLAKKFFPGEDPIGKRLIIDWDRPPVTDEIIGVVGDIKDQALDSDFAPTIFWPHGRQPYPFMHLIVRTTSDPMSMVGAIQNEIRAVDPEQPVSDIRPLSQVVSTSIARPRFNMLLLGIFAGVALVLASVGIYGVMSYSVTQRTHEIGIRMALGAQQSDVLRLLLKQGMTVAAFGIGIGLLGTFVLTLVFKKQLSSLLYEIGVNDPVTLAGISLILLIVALGAIFVPSRRATKVDPIEALRYE